MKAKRPRKPRLPASAIEIPGMPGSIMFPGPDFKNKSKLEQQELALLGPGLEALMSGDMVTYRKLGDIYRQLERKRKASKRKKRPHRPKPVGKVASPQTKHNVQRVRTRAARRCCHQHRMRRMTFPPSRTKRAHRMTDEESKKGIAQWQNRLHEAFDHNGILGGKFLF